MTVRDFNYQINENNKINDKHLQNRIAEAEIIIIAIGLNMLGVTKIRTANLIPAIFLPLILCLFM